MFRKVLDNYIFYVSKNKNKKYDVYDMKGNFITSFGARSYEQYFDRIGAYNNLNHNDENRRRLYYARHGKEAKKNSAKYFSHKYLW